MSNLSFAAILPAQEFWPIRGVTAAHHFFRNIDTIDKARRYDALVANRFGSADDENAFDEKLGKIARHKPKAEKEPR